MKEVNKEYYYHICTNNELNIGDIITTDKYNYFYCSIFDSEYKNNDNLDANQILLNMFNNRKLTFDSINDLNTVLNTISNDAFITRELMLEEVRKEINIELPSRLKCLFVTKLLEELSTWIDIFNRTNKKEYRMFKLELTGKIFKGDANYILRENISLNKKKDKAKLYWNQSITDNPIYEYLFDGSATIVEEIKGLK